MLNDYRDEIGAWLQTLGDVTPEGQVTKVLSEAEELFNAVVLGRGDVADEVADVFVTIFGFAALAGVNVDEALHRKMQRNRERKWKRQADGTFQHEEKEDDRD